MRFMTMQEMYIVATGLLESKKKIGGSVAFFLEVVKQG